MNDTHDIIPRKPWLAVVLSLLTLGLGQLYNGHWKKAAFIIAAEIPFYFLIVNAMASFAGMLAVISFILLVTIGVTVEAYVTARRSDEYALQSFNRWWVYALVIVLNGVVGTGVELMIGEGPYETYKVPSSSMLQTLQVGDHFIAETVDDDVMPERGNIIVFTIPGKDRHWVKRIIGLPGETLEIKDQVVHINSVPLDEPYALHTESVFQPQRDNFGPTTLGQGQYFVMGDNREKSFDSRWFGPVDRSGIKAYASYIYFPGNRDDDGWGARFGEKLR